MELSSQLKRKDSKIDYSLRHPKSVLLRHKNRFLSEVEEKELLRQESIDRYNKANNKMR